MQILPVNSTTGLLSAFLAHCARKVFFPLAKQKLSLAPGVGLVDFWSLEDTCYKKDNIGCSKNIVREDFCHTH